MEVYQTVTCPFCGGATTLGIDTSIGHQVFTVDCEVCCRPFEIRTECRPGEVVSLEVVGD